MENDTIKSLRESVYALSRIVADMEQHIDRLERGDTVVQLYCTGQPRCNVSKVTSYEGNLNSTTVHFGTTRRVFAMAADLFDVCVTDPDRAERMGLCVILKRKISR